MFGSKSNKDNPRAHLRPCEVDGHKAFFHRWVEQDQTVARANQILSFEALEALTSRVARGELLPKYCDVHIARKTYALIEYADGTVEQVRPERVKFTDL